MGKCRNESYNFKTKLLLLKQKERKNNENIKTLIQKIAAINQVAKNFNFKSMKKYGVEYIYVGTKRQTLTYTKRIN
jgi:5'-3' exonuclease